MSRRTGISTQMLHRYKQSLVEKGYLATIPRHRPSGGRTSNSYDFSGLFARLEQLLRRDRRDPAWQPTADEFEEQEQDAPQAVPQKSTAGAPGGRAPARAHQRGQTTHVVCPRATPRDRRRSRGVACRRSTPVARPGHPHGATGIEIPPSKTRRRDPAPGRPCDDRNGIARGNGRGGRNEGTIDEREQGTISETSRGGIRGTGGTNGTNGTRGGASSTERRARRSGRARAPASAAPASSPTHGAPDVRLAGPPR